MDDISRNSIGVIQENKNPKPQEEETKNRLCDFCGGESVALLYCRADTAKLCISCDHQVHSTNLLFTKHTRSLLCDVCDSSPSVIFCSNHSSVLCQNCDWESHGSVSPVHDRRPLEGFNGCPSVGELLAIFGIDDLGQNKKKSVDSGYVVSESDSGFSDYLIWDTPSVVSLDDLIVSDGSDHNFKVTDVPPLPKNRNTICGQYREEIICQLRQMAKSQTNFHDRQLDLEPSSDFHSLAFKDNYQQQDAFFNFEHKLDAAYFPSLEASAFKMLPDATVEDASRGLPSTPSQNFIEWRVPDENTETGQCLHQGNNGHQTQAENPVIVGVTQIQPKVAPRELTSQERDEAITRYREKKKSRRYEKQIRYESRKIRAESRVRIKGRFAKMDH